MVQPAKAFELSKLLHQRARLAIMSTLVAREEGVDFNELLRDLQLTRGNLAVHVRKLEEAGLIDVDKHFVGRMPRTAYSLTEKGRHEFAEYLELLSGIVDEARSGG